MTLHSQYGDPSSQVYDISDITSPIFCGAYNPVRRFYPSGAMVCYASPNMTYTGGNYNPNQPTKFDTTYGFLPQQNITENFPTTGGNGLYFYLVVTGINVNLATWNVVSSDPSPNNPAGSPATQPITATVSNTAAPSGTTGFIPYKADTMVLVTLNGPTKDSNATGAKAPLAYTDTSKSRSVTITITGNDGKSSVDYSFTINRWFMDNNYKLTTYDDHISWCDNLAGIGHYSMVGVSMLTNANGNSWINGLVGNGNYYKRIVGGGLFSEWGSLAYHPNFRIYATGNMTTDQYYSSSAKDGSVSRTTGVPGVNVNVYSFCATL